MARTQKVSIALRKDTLETAKKAAAADGLSLSGLLMRLLTAHFERQAKFAARGLKRSLPISPLQGPI